MPPGLGSGRLSEPEISQAVAARVPRAVPACPRTFGPRMASGGAETCDKLAACHEQRARSHQQRATSNGPKANSNRQLHQRSGQRGRLFKPHERGLTVLLSRIVHGWRDAVLLVKPEAVLRWHREAFLQPFDAHRCHTAGRSNMAGAKPSAGRPKRYPCIRLAPNDSSVSRSASVSTPSQTM